MTCPQYKSWALNNLISFPRQNRAHVLLNVDWALCDPSWEGKSRRKLLHEFLQTVCVFFPSV